MTMPKYAVHTPGLASRLIGGEEVIVSPKTSRVWVLNSAGAHVWELADGSLEFDEIAGRLAASRGIDAAAAHEELDALCQDLANRGLLIWRQAPGAPSARSQRAAALRPKLPEPPRMLAEETLQVVAGLCDSGYSGLGFCMTWPTCAAAWG